MRRSTALIPILLLAGCTTSERAAPLRPPPPPSAVLPAAPAAHAVSGPVLDGSGACTGTAPGGAAAIETGIGECELVRLKGRPPTDVLIGEGRSGREVQVLYMEPGAKELYFFVNNRLDRIVR
ncbi:hypothetical protein MPAR168_03020 [Methylorubrum populi]|uniref:Lipoprotein n=1 Tax=Methylobacterium radiotolerans TaxID=31998 RepID=A0ABU7TB22_9HYPH|nr:hypothetical protein [Methylobacterium sp. B4]PXW64212.1 hypothetical protein BY998_104266 [Methylobacterium sp. B4]